MTPTSAGAAPGVGFNLNVSNADHPTDLLGDARTVGVDTPVGSASLTTSGDTWTATVSGGLSTGFMIRDETTTTVPVAGDFSRDDDE